ncbi:MAG: hypothetical protein V4525_12510 [Pseudomonadota bacterium]
MKLTDLHKNKGLKINGQVHHSGANERFGKDSTPASLDRKAQRKLDQAAGLIPFAVKLNSELVKQITELAQTRNTPLNEVVAELLQKGLSN